MPGIAGVAAGAARALCPTAMRRTRSGGLAAAVLAALALVAAAEARPTGRLRSDDTWIRDRAGRVVLLREMRIWRDRANPVHTVTIRPG